MHVQRVQEGMRVGKIFYVIRAYFARMQYGVNWHTHTHVEEICDMFIQISEYLRHRH